MDSNESDKCIDRISNLPVSILGRILSYLPTKEAVAASILSTRWKTLFPSVVPLTRLDLDDSYMFRSPPRYFMEFVDKLLNVALLDVTCVETVVISCENQYGDDKIVSWVCAALRLNVHHLRLMSYLRNAEALFHSLNGCTTLVELELGKNFELCIPEEFILPNLKRLSLYSLSLGDGTTSIRELLAGCPLLDGLRIYGCDSGVLEILDIKHPVLNKLFIDGSVDDAGSMVVIHAPNLEAFDFVGKFVVNYVLMNIKYLHSVSIDCDYLSQKIDGYGLHFNSLQLAQLVKACSSTTRLRLPGNSVMGLCFSLCVSLPTFQNLTCLWLGCMRSRGWKLLAQFLESAPNLTILIFEEELQFIGAHARYLYSLPSSPVCLELNVKKIEIWVFEWRPSEIKLIQFFLNKGRVLEELIVHCLPHKNPSNLEKLSMLPRHSKACQVVLKDKINQGKSRFSCKDWF